MAYMDIQHTAKLIKIDQSYGTVAGNILTIPQTVNFAMTDPNGAIRNANDGIIPSDGDILLLYHGNGQPSITFNDYSTSNIGSIVSESGGVYSLSDTSFDGNDGMYVYPDKYLVRYNRRNRYFDNVLSDPNKIIGEFRIPNVSLAELQSMELKVSPSGGNQVGAILYLCVKDVVNGGVYDLEDKYADFATRNTVNDIPLFLINVNATANDYAVLDAETVPTGIAIRRADPTYIDIDWTKFGNFKIGAEVIIRYQNVPFYNATAGYTSVSAAIQNYRTDYNENGTSYSVGDDNFRIGAFYSGDPKRNPYNFSFATTEGTHPAQDYVLAQELSTTGFPDGSTRCIINKSNATYGFEDWFDANFQDGGMITTPNLEVEVVVPGGDYYVDITEGTPDGVGSPDSPYNLLQFEEYIRDDIVNEDVFYVRGHYEVPEGRYILLDELGNPSTGGSAGNHVGITIRGWDVDIYGPPVIKWNDVREGDQLNGGYNRWWDDTQDYIDVTFRDFVFDCYSTMAIEYLTNIGRRVFKDVHFVVNGFVNHNGVSSSGPWSHEFYGCTFNAQELKFQYLTECVFVDCVIDANEITIDSIGKLDTFNNTTNIEDFTGSITNIDDLSEYIVPIYNSSIISTPIIDDFETFVGYYTSQELMFYERYNIPRNDSPIIQNIRLNEGYNTGLFANPRLSYGAYSFSGDFEIDIDEDFPTSGHVGAFYFGGDYSNVTNPIDNAPITIDVGDSLVQIDSYIDIDEVNLDLSIPNKDFATGVRNFFIDFVATKRKGTYLTSGDRDYEYPKFCGLYDTPAQCNNCDTPDNGDIITVRGDQYNGRQFKVIEIDYVELYCYAIGMDDGKRYRFKFTELPSMDDYMRYIMQVTGGTPLTVDFKACAQAVGEFEGYEVDVYKWYFDYENNPTEYVTCSGPYATHSFCGGYLEEFDVRLCVDFIQKQ